MDNLYDTVCSYCENYGRCIYCGNGLEPRIFPLKTYKYNIPIGTPGAFGAIRKFDIHTGVDLYCEYYDEVIAMEDGEVISIENFTGESAGYPWWNETKAVLVKGQSGIILYGEIEPVVKVGDKIKQSSLIGNVLTVLKKDKGKNPPNMLHIELYSPEATESTLWHHDEECPKHLRNVTPILLTAKR